MKDIEFKIAELERALKQPLSSNEAELLYHDALVLKYQLLQNVCSLSAKIYGQNSPITCAWYQQLSNVEKLINS